MYNLNESPLLRKWCPYNGKFTFLPRCLILLLFIYVANMLEALPSSIALFVLGWEELSSITMDLSAGFLTDAEYSNRMVALLNEIGTHPLYIALGLFGTLFTVIAVLLFTFRIERRTAASIGLGSGVGESSLSYLAGFGIGAVLLLLTLGLNLLFGSITLTVGSQQYVWVIVFLFAFVIQAASEEFLIRGFIMTAFIRPGRSPWIGISVSTALFTLLHAFNDYFSPIAFINIALFGLLLSVLTVRTGNLWAACGLHAAWNFLQGNMFGISVSGTAEMPSLFGSIIDPGKFFLNGGGFGIEGGLLTTLTVSAAVALVVFLPAWRHDEWKPFIEL